MPVSRSRQALFAAVGRTVVARVRAVRLDVLVRRWLVGAVILFALYVVWMPGPIDSGGRRMGGDILQFYAAGQMVLAGRGADLYDLEAQAIAQRKVTAPSAWPRVAPYLNPPILAAAWTPIAALPFKAAYVASTGALLGALLIGLRALRPHFPALHAQWPLVVGLTVLFIPMFRTVTGGQNTALTFALLAGGYASLRSGRDRWAGLWLGLLLYKPQYAVLPALLLVLSRRWSGVAAFGLTAAAQYVVGALVCGVDWPIKLVRFLESIMPRALQTDAHQLISWLSFAQYAWPGRPGKLIGAVLTVATLAVLVWIWCVRPRTPSGAGAPQWTLPAVRGRNFAVSFGAAVAATIACSPYTQWYESGLLIIPALVAIDQSVGETGAPSPMTPWAVAAAFVGVPVFQLAPLLGWQPLALLAPLLLAWLVRLQMNDSGRSMH